MHPNAFAAGALLQTLLGELTTLLQTLAVFERAAKGKGREGEKGKEGRERGGKGKEGREIGGKRKEMDTRNFENRSTPMVTMHGEL